MAHPLLSTTEVGEGPGTSSGAGVPPALLTSEHGAYGVAEAAAEQKQPSLSPHLTKNKLCGVSASTQ